MTQKETAYETITQLVERFDEQKASYKRSEYNEALVRKDFIDPFFKALGWDMDNAQGYAEAYREVIHEDRVKVGTATKAPDYSFRLPGGKRLFFVEAKKPSVLVKTDILPAYQVRRYAWSAKLPVSILTDFEEFAVYDCNKKPAPTDKASTGRIQYLTYDGYLKNFDFIWDAFAKERVLKGSFDKFVAGEGARRGTTTVDKEFLLSLDGWRMQLAQNIALRNPGFSEDELNFAVQQTLDRIIFLRIAEDRGVEEYAGLKKLLTGEAYYQNLFQHFREADEKYNSGLFDFKRDKLSAGLQLDNNVLKPIISELYYPASPYEFSVLSVEILGSAYEQFLGKQITLNDRHKVVVEEKPEVRKAGGVYYTPQYIVDYIVQQTVGKLVEGKKPEQVASLRIVDPACGSGSFLIGAYQYLLAWHRDYYNPEWDRLSAIAASNDYNSTDRNKAVKDRSKLPLTPDGALTTALKKSILRNNIFGVDIDTQAVEVTKLSLLL
ncbi:MAG TPA: N-6 DNA methylase [Chitinophagaceae bacterium]|nr:N-6 DNA methylase [Chitinophagaceae bacterium]